MDGEKGVYNEPWNDADDDYEEMDCILLIHTHEGEPIARFIQENLRRLQVMVNVCDVTELESRNINFQVTLLLVTPEMITYMNDFGDSFRPGLHCKMNRAFGILVDKSVNMEEETIKSVLGNSLPDFKSWKIIKLTQTQPTMIQILDLLDGTQESAMPTTLKYHLQPAVITDGDKVFVLFKGEKKSSDNVVVRAGNQTFDTIYHNPYTFAFTPCGLSCGEVKVDVLVNKKSEGSTKVTVQNRLHTLQNMMGNIFSPFEFLCQVLPLSEKQRKELDNELENRMNADGFEKNVDRIVFDLSQSSGMDADFPTILHFCAKFGLAKACKLMKLSKGYDEALTIINKDGDTPSTLAKKMGYEQMSADLDPLEAPKKSPSDPYSLVRGKEKKKEYDYPPPLPERKNYLHTSMKSDRPKQVSLKRSPSDIGGYSSHQNRTGYWTHIENTRNQHIRHFSFDDNSKCLNQENKRLNTRKDTAFPTDVPFPTIGRSFQN
eukprot:XP_011419263.1 PREDICTED: uncharacterized protein LOC105322317 isoform X1 [Crassostrea gigas]